MSGPATTSTLDAAADSSISDAGWHEIKEIAAHAIRGDELVALELLRRTIASHVEDQYFLLHLGTILLTFGAIRPAYTALHAGRRARWRAKFGAPVREPYWSGDSLSGRRILVRYDEGNGDMLQRWRYLRLLTTRCDAAGVLLEVPPVLVRLARWDPSLSVISWRSPRIRPAGSYDTWALISGLPDLFGAAPDTIPSPPYLEPPPALMWRWRHRLDAAIGLRRGALRVGLNWAGDPLNSEAYLRDIPLAAYAPLFRVRGVQLVSLQKIAHELDPAPAGYELPRIGAEFSDFADMAACIANLDLVISSDTAVVHVAGALGVQTWTLLSTPSADLWAANQGCDIPPELTPWYPNMRLFHQQRTGEWSDPIERVAAELTRLVAERGAA